MIKIVHVMDIKSLGNAQYRANVVDVDGTKQYVEFDERGLDFMKRQARRTTEFNNAPSTITTRETASGSLRSTVRGPQPPLPRPVYGIEEPRGNGVVLRLIGITEYKKVGGNASYSW